MAVTIKSILRKKSWTGEEVGRALILNLIHSWKEQLAGKGRLHALFPPEQFNMMVRSLEGSEVEIYNNYVGLNNWLITNKALANGYYLQAEAGIKKFFGILTTAAAAENIYKYIEKIPLIVTESQYDRLAEENREKVFATWGDVDLFSLMWDALEHYARELWDNPDAKNPLQTIKKKYEGAPVKSKLLKDIYTQLSDNGYWQLEDGTRSDQVTGLEWIVASLKPEYRDRVQGILKNYEDAESITTDAQELLKILADGMYKQDAVEEELAQQGRSDKDIDDALAEIGSEYLQPKVWHSNEKAGTLTKWDIVSQPTELNEYYSVLHNKRDRRKLDKKEYLTEAEDFASEFPELVKILLADISKKTGRDVTKLKLEQWQDTCWAVRELYDGDIYGYKGTVDSRHLIFNGDTRAVYAGVAVVKEAGYAMVKSPDGDYVPPTTTNPLAGNLFGLDQYVDTNPAFEKNVANIRECRENILTGYKAVLVYDTACEMIAKYTKLKDFVCFKQGADQIKEEIKAINAYVPILYLSISETNYSDKEAQKKKLEALREYLCPLDVDGVVIEKKHYQEAWDLLSANNMRVFGRNTQEFFLTLGGQGYEYKQ